jgi:hypothetical protein
LCDTLAVQNGGRVANYRRSGGNLQPTTLPANFEGGSFVISGGAGAQSQQQVVSQTSIAKAPQIPATTLPTLPSTPTNTAATVATTGPATAPVDATEPGSQTLSDAVSTTQRATTTQPSGTVLTKDEATDAQVLQQAQAAPPARERDVGEERHDVVIVVQPDIAATAGGEQVQQRVEQIPATAPAVAPNAAAAPTTQP